MTTATRLWVCMECGATWELPARDAPEWRDAHRGVYCSAAHMAAAARRRAVERAADAIEVERGPK